VGKFFSPGYPGSYFGNGEVGRRGCVVVFWAFLRAQNAMIGGLAFSAPPIVYFSRGRGLWPQARELYFWFGEFGEVMVMRWENLFL